MPINVDEIVEKASAILQATENYNVKDELSNSRIINIVPKMKVYFRMMKMIFESFESIVNNPDFLNASELLRAQLVLLIKGLHGDNNDGIKKGLELLFSSIQINKDASLKKMTAKFLITSIRLMSDEINIKKNIDHQNSKWSSKALVYLDKNYITNELLEVPLRYQ